MIPTPRGDRPHSKTNDHTWIISTKEEIENWEMPQSSSREAYVIPSKTEDEIRIGSRRKLYEMLFHHESQRELFQKQMNEEEAISEKTTEYMGSYNWWKCPQITEHEKEMQRKYPLYSNEPCSSFWKENACTIPGLTPSLDTKRIFHKNHSFTKPINEVLDDPYVNCRKIESKISAEATNFVDTLFSHTYKYEEVIWKSVSYLNKTDK